MDRHERSDKETWVRQVRQRIKSGFGKTEFGQKVRTDKRDQTEGELGQTKIGLVETEVRQKLLGERERELGQTQLGLVDGEVRQKELGWKEREGELCQTCPADGWRERELCQAGPADGCAVNVLCV